MDWRRVSDGVTIAGSAALLFAIEPMIAKSLLPRFGGTAGVWVASMMFFQIVLLAGYLYSYWITRYAGPGVRTAVHVALAAASLAVLPLAVPARAGATSGHPTVEILGILAATVGLPFLVLSTTNTLVQWWRAGRAEALPYGLFAVSNAACLAALLAYPLVLEPHFGATALLREWSLAYGAVALLLVGGALANRGAKAADEGEIEDASEFRPWLWMALAAAASALWLGAANHLSQEVAAIPLLWVLPLAIYLGSFVVTFGGEGVYRPRLFRWLLPLAWLGLGWRTGIADTAGNLGLDIAAILLSLAVLCVFCHGELARRRPAARRGLAHFYLMTATGGALGGIFVGVVAPAIFSTYLEFPVAVVGTVFLALPLVYGYTARKRLLRLGLVAMAAFVVSANYRGGASEVARQRNFYGAFEIRDRSDGGDAVRTLYNGRTVHGVEFLDQERLNLPTAYYGRRSGVGLLLEQKTGPRRVGLVGLGAGTLAAYGREGDTYRFYELNAAVTQAARKYFGFLGGSKAGVDVVEGDGRLRLAEEPAGWFDVIVLDAFSDDAIPVHLLTREAFRMYFARLRADGVVAVHVSNRYLDLNPVVEALAADAGKQALEIHSQPDGDDRTFAADWVIVGGDGETMESLRPFAHQHSPRAGPLWTDEYSNLLQIWR